MFGFIWINMLIVFFTVLLINPQKIKYFSYLQEKNIYIKGVFGMVMAIWGFWDFYFSLTDLPLFIKWMPFRAIIFIANFLFFIVAGFVMAYPMLSRFFVSEKDGQASERRLKSEAKIIAFGHKFASFGLLLIVGLVIVAFHLFN